MHQHFVFSTFTYSDHHPSNSAQVVGHVQSKTINTVIGPVGVTDFVVFTSITVYTSDF